MKYSKQREALLTLLRSTRSHPSADWLYENLRKEFPNISLGTVYRNLAQACGKRRYFKNQHFRKQRTFRRFCPPTFSFRM